MDACMIDDESANRLDRRGSAQRSHVALKISSYNDVCLANTYCSSPKFLYIAPRFPAHRHCKVPGSTIPPAGAVVVEQ